MIKKTKISKFKSGFELEKFSRNWFQNLFFTSTDLLLKFLQYFFTITECNPSEFRCSSGDCIDGSKRCNRIPDCPDGDDEDERCRKFLSFIIFLFKNFCKQEKFCKSKTLAQTYLFSKCFKTYLTFNLSIYL